jgi:hypothetical protein
MSVIIIWSDRFPLPAFTSLNSSSYSFDVGDYSIYLLTGPTPMTFIVINDN